MVSMAQRSLKQIMILLMMAARSAEDVTRSDLVDRMVMADSVVPVLLPEFRQIEQSSGGEYALKAKRPNHVNYLQELLNAHMFSCLTLNSGSRPAGIEVTPDPDTGDIAMMKLNMSRIFRDMSLWKITNTEHQVGMYYFSGNTGENDFHQMLSLEDLDDAIGLAVIPGYEMIDKYHLTSIRNLVDFFNLALDNVWSQKLHSCSHLALWNNIFRILVEVCSGGREHVKSPHGHQSTCSCYRMIPHILKVCEWIKTHSEEEANMTDNPAQALRAILDKIGHVDVCSTGHLCPLLFGLLPILGIKSLHIEKDVISYDGALDSIVRAKIERLSVEGAFTDAIKPLLYTLAQTNDDGHCSWKHLKAPGWEVSSDVFVEIVTKLKQLESIEDVTVRVYYKPGYTIAVFNNPRARRLLSKCIVSWGSPWCNLSQDMGLRWAIEHARIEHLLFPHGEQVDLLVNHPGIWQRLKTVRCSDTSVSLTFERVITLARIIPSLEKIIFQTLLVTYDGTPTDTFTGKTHENFLSTSKLRITCRAGFVLSISSLELLWKILTGELSTLFISGMAVESLPAPESTPAFANKFRELRIYDFDCLSTDMCSYLGNIGGGVETLVLDQEQYSSTPASERNEKLAALLGTTGEATPLGRSVITVSLDCEISVLIDYLEPLLHCVKLATIRIDVHKSAKNQDDCEAISFLAAGLTKFAAKENGPKFKLHFLRLKADELAKLLREICPGSDPSRVVACLDMTYIKGSEFRRVLRRELARYKPATKIFVHPITCCCCILC